MSHTTMEFFDLWQWCIYALLYGIACAVLLYVLWLIVTVPSDKPRPMWEPKEKHKC